jgi:SAM-dependent methyltransferase
LSVRYELGGDNAWRSFADALGAEVTRPGVRRICELGGGAHPAIPLDFVERNGLDYTVIDISAEELAKAPDGYVKVMADVTSPSLPDLGSFDLVLSRTLLEHVREPESLHRNVLRLLAPGGHALHFFPTLYEPTMVFNRLMPERLTRPLLTVGQPYRGRGGEREKFHAYYRWCRGPKRRQVARFEGLGYEVVDYVGFFGTDYFLRVPPLHRVQSAVARALIEHPLPSLTSAAWVALRKPG